MEKIFGRVVVKDTNAGLANLVVKAYSSRKPLGSLSAPHKGKTLTGLEFICQHGQSIGSVITDSEGKFEIDATCIRSTWFQRKKYFFVVVFAPQDICESEKPFSLPAEKRVLFVSNSSPEITCSEAFMIRLPHEQVALFQNPSSMPENQAKKSEASLNEFLNHVEQGERLQSLIKEKVRPKLEEQVKAENDDRLEIAKKMENFSLLPLEMRKNPFLMKAPKDLEALQKKAVDEGLERLKKQGNEINILISTQDLEALRAVSGEKLVAVNDASEDSEIAGSIDGHKGNDQKAEAAVFPKSQGDSEFPVEDKEITGQLNTSALLAKIRSFTGGGDLIRKADMLPSLVSPEYLYTKYFPEEKEAVIPGKEQHKQI